MAVQRWHREPELYLNQIFSGTVLDVGGAGDCIARYRSELPRLGRVTGLDLDPMPNGLLETDWLQMPATQMPEGLQFDTVYSSHCLEHIEQHLLPTLVSRLWAAVRPGGYLLLIVPDMEMYERGHWPSRYNCDHKTTWVESRTGDEPHYCMGLRELVEGLPNSELLRIARLFDGFDPNAGDQTGSGACECGIEAVVRKQEKR